MQKEINSSRLYRIMAKILPDSIVLAKFYDNKENKAERKETENLKRMLKGDSNNSSFSKAASDNIDENSRMINVVLEKKSKENEPSLNHNVPSSQIFLDESAITRKKEDNALPSF